MARLRFTSVDAKQTLRRLADEELMALVAGNDADAYEVVLERHADAAFSLAYRICGRRALAEDIVQDALLAVWRSGGRYDRTRGSVRTWLLGVVHNRAIDALRRSTVHDRVRAGDDQAAERIEAPERTEVEVARREEARSMQAVLGALPSEQRRVVELAYFGGFTHEQIAEMLGAPLGTVKGRMRLALEKMRASIEPRAAVIVVLVLVLWGGGSGTRTIQAQLTGPAQSAGARASLRVSGARAQLVLTGLPAPAANHVDELWVQRGSAAPAPAGTFVVRTG